MVRAMDMCIERAIRRNLCYRVEWSFEVEVLTLRKAGLMKNMALWRYGQIKKGQTKGKYGPTVKWSNQKSRPKENMVLRSYGQKKSKGANQRKYGSMVKNKKGTEQRKGFYPFWGFYLLETQDVRLITSYEVLKGMEVCLDTI